MAIRNAFGLMENLVGLSNSSVHIGAFLGHWKGVGWPPPPPLPDVPPISQHHDRITNHYLKKTIHVSSCISIVFIIIDIMGWIELMMDDNPQYQLTVSWNPWTVEEVLGRRLQPKTSCQLAAPIPAGHPGEEFQLTIQWTWVAYLVLRQASHS